jgi:HD superfamily phosphohydrolase
LAGVCQVTGQASLEALWNSLRNCGPIVARVLDYLAPRLIEGRRLRETEPDKKFNDPIWKTITLNKAEVALLDMRLMQRLRKVRQLGLANLVYPSAQHTRFEHSLGALHAAERIARTVDRGIEDRFLRDIRIAALLHDCGHTAFSHVGERAIRRHKPFLDSFDSAKDTLHDFFADPIRDHIQTILGTTDGASRPLPTKGPPVAEIVSALLILSPAMIQAGRQMQLTDDDFLRAASLVLGRPHSLISADGSSYADYVKSIVSSDLDADKLDYVARDAYIAGIPIAADVERLMSQLVLVNQQIPLETGGLPVARAAQTCKILAVLPSGVASIEIFIMTRAYLFSRVYQHPKIRLAEALLERSLFQAILRRIGDSEIRDETADAVLDLMYGTNGDDACLDLLDREGEPDDQLSERLRRPRRVLALSPRLVHGYDRASGQPSRLLAEAWSIAATQIQQAPWELEAAVAKTLNVPSSNMVVDWQRQANIKENPAVFVADQFSQKLIPLSEAFDIGQLAAAYDDVKSVAWVFADHIDATRASAGAAIASVNLFGLVPTREALAQAKIDPSAYSSALDTVPTNELDRFAAGQARRVAASSLTIPHVMVKAAFGALPEDDALIVSMRLADAFNKSSMSAAQFQSILASITVSGLVVEYVERAAQRQPRHSLPIDETELQRDVKQWLDTRIAGNKEIVVEREHPSPAGRVDLTVHTARGLRRVVPVEMKAEEGRFETVVAKNLAQPFQYLTNTPYEHVGILLCRYLATDEQRQSSLVRVEFSSVGDPPTAVICIGQHVPRGSASETKSVDRPTGGC